jgi:hypothetical protein
MIAPSSTRLLLALLVAIAMLFAVLMILPASPGGGPTPHPDYPGMLVAGDGSQGRAIVALSWAFGALEIALFSVLVWLGAGRRAAARGFARPLLGWSLVYVLVWTLIVAAYRGWIAGTSGPSLLQLPLPTVMLLTVMGPLPLFYVVLYVRYFHRWVFDDADAARLQALVEMRGRE